MLKYLLHHYKNLTLAILTGFVLGSLNKIWPWKETLKTIVVEGEVRPLVEKNILPSVGNPGDQFYLALLMLVAGVTLILSVEIGLTRNKKHS